MCRKIFATALSITTFLLFKNCFVVSELMQLLRPSVLGVTIGQLKTFPDGIIWEPSPQLHTKGSYRE